MQVGFPPVRGEEAVLLDEPVGRFVVLPVSLMGATLVMS